MARATKTAVDEYAIGGARLNIGEMATWTPQDDAGGTSSESSYCGDIDAYTLPDGSNGGCRVPQTVVIMSTDFEDPSQAYYVKTKNCESCEQELWVPAAELTRVETSKALNDLRELVTKINNDAITIKELKKVCAEILTAFTIREQESDAKPKGVCSACFTDIEFVGGAWQHSDKRTCNSPAVILA